MKRIAQILFSITLFCVYQNGIMADPIISVFMEPYPHAPQDADKLSNKMSRAGKIGKYHIRGLSFVGHPLIAGIASTYGGYLGSSDVNGQTLYPRKHSAPQLHILVTNKITPIVMFEQTIHHWDLVYNTPVEMYKATIEKDEQTGISFWNIKKEAIPEDTTIPLDSLLIVAKPTSIHIPEGITITDNETNLVLPPIYIKKGINIAQNALYLINMAHFFRPVRGLFRKQDDRYTRLLHN